MAEAHLEQVVEGVADADELIDHDARALRARRMKQELIDRDFAMEVEDWEFVAQKASRQSRHFMHICLALYDDSRGEPQATKPGGGTQGSP